MNTILEGLGWVAAALAFPGTIALTALTVAAWKRPKTIAASSRDRLPRMGIIVPAHDEEAVIRRCVESLYDSAGLTSDDRIVVVADNCTDATVLHARQAGAHVLVRDNPAKRGKGYALDHAFTRLAGLRLDAYLVVDADSIVDRRLLTKVKSAVARGAAAVQVAYGVKDHERSARTRLMHLALLAYNRLRPAGRQSLGFSAGILGNGFALTRRLIEQVPYDAASIVEDVEYHQKLVLSGNRVVFLEDAIVWADMPAGGKGVSSQRARWEGGRLRLIWTRGPELFRALARGRFAAIEPLTDLLLLPLAFHALLLGLAALSPHTLTSTCAVWGLGIVMLHVLTAVARFGSLKDLAALGTVPQYVLWKLVLIPRLLLNATQNADWVRTARTDITGGTQ